LRALRGKEPEMIEESRLRRIHFRAWHRGTKEADLLIGGFFDTYGRGWTEAQAEWFETLIEEQDVDIMAWAIGTATVPARFEGDMMQAMRKLDYIPIAK
jgi:antitoxin CptB